MKQNKDVDNVFCKAIASILKIPEFNIDTLPANWLDFHSIGYMDGLRREFNENGFNDVEFKEEGTFIPSVEKLEDRTPLADIDTKLNQMPLKNSKKLMKARRNNNCQFCENNQEPAHVYRTHSLRNSSGELTCPRLRKYVCPICSATGDKAHTVRYCNKKPIYVIKEGSDYNTQRGLPRRNQNAIRI